MSDLAQLRESEERYALAMRAMNEAVYDYDVASDQIYYSERIYDVLDVPREFLRTAKDWRTLIHSDDVARYLETFAAHIKRRTERFECDYRYRARGDVWHWARQHGIALRDAAGRAVRVVGSIGDITQLKHTEEALRQSQERYDFAMQAINEGVYDWDIVNDAVYYSERVQRAIGLSPELLSTAKDWRDRIHPDDLPRFDSAMVAHFKQQTERFECDYRYRALDGNWRWARTHGLALRDERGRAVRMIGSTGDITELKRTEEALRHSEERYALATAVATEGIYEWNVADGSLFLSDRARAFFAVPDGQLDARAWNASVHPEDFSAYRQAVLDHFKGRSDRLEHEYRIANANGEYRWVVDRAIAVRDAKGRVTRLIGALTDMTRRKLAEMELRRAREQAEAASREKSRFLANMSHELRTPLNAIIGFSEVLAERMFGEVNEKQAEYVKDIHESGRHLLSLINDILDLSKIEAGRMELELSTFDLPSALSNAMTLVRERAQRHGIELGLDVDKRLGGFQADERKVKQILLNLLSNAVKFTPDGGRIDVSAKFNASKVEIAVKDTGIGISPEDQPRMFEEFKQVGNDATHKAEGTGLGLALTRRFVELHGGEIRLASVPGKGSTFTITLPVRQ